MIHSQRTNFVALAAWAFIRDQIQDILDDPERANLEYDGHFGRTDLASTISSFYRFDLIVHAGDIAHPLEVDVPSDADRQTKVLAQLGRAV